MSRLTRCMVGRSATRVRGRLASAAALSVLLLAGGPPTRAEEAPPTAIANAESSAPVSTLQGARLLSMLRRGGYVVYFRHAATDHSKNDSGMKGYADCENQRPLSAQGKREATEVGRTLRALQLAAGEVLASPYCRTMDHARLMFGHATPRAEIREADAGDYAGLKRLLASPVPPGRNRWIVGHGNPFRAVAGPPHLAEGEAAVIEPGTTRWTVVARIDVRDWQALAAAS